MMISGLGGANAAAGIAKTGPAAPSAAVPASRPANDEEQLLGFLRNITRADAAEVLALTRPSKGETQQSHSAVVDAYGEF